MRGKQCSLLTFGEKRLAKKKPQKLECFAYLPPIQSAIMISGDGDLLRAKFNINLSISPDAAKLMLMTGRKLKLIVEEVPESKPDKEKEEPNDREKIRNPLYNKANQ